MAKRVKGGERAVGRSLATDGTLMAGAGSSKSFLSLACDGGPSMLPYCIPLPGVLARPDRSLPGAAAVGFADPEPERSGPPKPSIGAVVLRGGVKVWLMPKKMEGVVYVC